MRLEMISLCLFAALVPLSAAAQSARPRENTVAIGGGVGFLASDTRESGTPQALQATTGNVDAFVEYYYTPRASLRGMYGWASPPFESVPGRTLRRQHVNLNFLYNWEFGRFRPFASVGGGAYFLNRRENGEVVGDSVTKPGGSVGWGGEYYFRTFAVRSEMNVHILGEEKRFSEFDGHTLTAFTWTFGVKVPF